MRIENHLSYAAPSRDRVARTATRESPLEDPAFASSLEVAEPFAFDPQSLLPHSYRHPPAGAGEGSLPAAPSQPLSWWYSVPAALSWLLRHTIDGFALYGQTIYAAPVLQQETIDIHSRTGTVDKPSVGADTGRSHDRDCGGKGGIGNVPPPDEAAMSGRGRRAWSLVVARWTAVAGK